MNKLTATELAKNLSDVLNRIRYRGEQFLIERNGEPIATLNPVSAPSRVTLSELAVALRDLELPGDGFAEDLEAIQSAQSIVRVPEWPN